MISGPYLPPMALGPAQSSVPQDSQVRKYGDALKVTFDEAETDLVSGETRFFGKVVAVYGQTRIECGSLVINEKEHRGAAETGVTLTDPEGTLKCKSLTFDWENKEGEATDVELIAESAHIRAASIHVKPDNWLLTKARGSLSRTDDAPVQFEASSVTLAPGRSGVARHVYLRIFGARIGPLSRWAFSLRKRVKGLGLPSITNRKGKGLGVAWESGFAIGDHGVANAFWEAFPRREPGFGLQYGSSPLSPEATSLIAPRSDLGERAVDGWFDNVSVRRKSEEQDEIGSPRLSYGVGTFWNQGTTARPADLESLSKRWDLAYEVGGPLRGSSTGGYAATARLQSLRPGSREAFRDRALVSATFLAPSHNLTQSLQTHARLDLFGTVSSKESFGWARVETGLVYSPSAHITLGAAGVFGRESGQADFPFDRLVSKNAIHGRIDFTSGPYTVRFLAKYDMDLKKWTDREYEIALVAREFEPYLVFRQFPSETRIGVRFRIDNLRDRLTRRNQRR